MTARRDFINAGEQNLAHDVGAVWTMISKNGWSKH
jgi:hypothetical protein